MYFIEFKRCRVFEFLLSFHCIFNLQKHAGFLTKQCISACSSLGIMQPCTDSIIIGPEIQCVAGRASSSEVSPVARGASSAARRTPRAGSAVFVRDAGHGIQGKAGHKPATGFDNRVLGSARQGSARKAKYSALSAAAADFCN